MESDLITVSDAAKLANVSSTAVRNWIKSGKINGVLKVITGLKKGYFVSESEVIKLLKSAE